MILPRLIACIAVGLCSAFAAETLIPRDPDTLSLAGDWRFALDPNDRGLTIDPATWSFPDTIQLPGSTAAQNKGPEFEIELKMDKETMNRLRERHPYVGPAWYQREVEIPAGWRGKDIRLTLERVLWESRVWVDGQAIGEPQQSLSVPHRYNLTKALVAGKKHTLTLRIDNREIVGIGTIGHAYTEGTQTIWNGAIGKLELEALPKSRTEDLHLVAKSDGTLELEVSGSFQRGQKLVASVRLSGAATAMPIASTAVIGTSARLTGRLPGAKPWSELSPTLYELDLTLTDAEGRTLHTLSRTFGFREFTAKGRDLLINGTPSFLRGNLECAIFPQTGHPDAEGPQWEKIMRTSREYGLNHLRFHSWCPPEAAFDAADRHGIYLQVELPNWTFKMGQNPPVDAFFLAEGERILREYGHHPSFVMFSLGNELTGDLEAMDRLVEQLRRVSPERLFTSTSFAFSPRGKLPGPADDFFISQQTQSGWVRGQGFLNATYPSTDTDYAEGLECLSIPLVTHEVGQYVVYPDLSTLSKYDSTPLRSTAMEVIQRDLREKGLLADASRFTRDSGKLAALLYKEDIERALRTKGLAGIQLLQLQDFPGQSTATVGLLDAFWDSKGVITPDAFRQFSSPVVPLARMKKFVWENNETFTVDLELANFSEAPFPSSFTVQLLGTDGIPLATHSYESRTFPVGNGRSIGRFELPLDRFEQATRLELAVTSEDGSASNTWPVWVFPATAPAGIPGDLVILDSPGPELNKALAAGRRVLLLPSRVTVAEPIDARFIPVFWSPLHFPNQPGTLGATINPEHPVFTSFPTDTHTNWQWWDLFSTSFAMNLETLDPRPAMPLRFIDKYNRNALPAALWEAKVGPGRLFVCTLDISSKIAERPAARQLRQSLLNYLASEQFQPTTPLASADLDSLFKSIRFRAIADSAEPGTPVEAAVDGDPTTIWHSEWRSGKERLPASFAIDLGAATEIRGFNYHPRRDSDRGRIARYRIESSDDAQTWKKIGSEAAFPNSTDAQAVSFKQPVRARYIRIVALSDYGGAKGAAIAEFEPLFEGSSDTRGLGIVPGFNDGE